MCNDFQGFAVYILCMHAYIIYVGFQAFVIIYVKLSMYDYVHMHACMHRLHTICIITF